MKKLTWLVLAILGGLTLSVASCTEQQAATMGPASIVEQFQRPRAENAGFHTERATVALTYYTCEDGFCGSTANGTTVHPGTAACDRSWMGRKFIILGDPSGRTYTCEDTGGAVNGNHVDIWFATHAEGRALIRSVGTTATSEFR
jgi:3D (Asp-Asp-Asp) domain-containing protein